MEFGFELVCDQVWTYLRPDSVMEFGFKEIRLICYRTAHSRLRRRSVAFDMMRVWQRVNV